MSDFTNYFSRLRERLKQAGISERQLALAAGLDPQRLSRLLNRQPDAKLSTITRLEDALTKLLQLELPLPKGTTDAAVELHGDAR